MTDICKCGHETDDDLILAIKASANFINSMKDEIIRLRSSTERMADVVSAAVRWRKWENKGNSASAGCDCESCTLLRVVDRYISNSCLKQEHIIE